MDTGFSLGLVTTFLLDGGDQFGYIFLAVKDGFDEIKTRGGRTSVENAVDNCAASVGVAAK